MRCPVRGTETPPARSEQPAGGGVGSNPAIRTPPPTTQSPATRWRVRPAGGYPDPCVGRHRGVTADLGHCVATRVMITQWWRICIARVIPAA